MNIPVQITFRHMDSSPALEQLIREQVAKIEILYPRLITCRVLIEAPHQRHRQGKHFRVLVDASLPGAELIADRAPDLRAEHEDAYTAVREAFRHLRRELQANLARRREPLPVYRTA
jgi:ribosome-associated translation inhibitor RaiA